MAYVNAGNSLFLDEVLVLVAFVNRNEHHECVSVDNIETR